MKSIDIVIPSADRVDDLLRLLQSLPARCGASWPGLVASVTVSDDRHADRTARRLAKAHRTVRYVAGPARGPAANRNHGAAQGRADWILFLDDDCYVETDLLQAYAEAAASAPGASVIEGAIHAVGARPNGNHHAPLNTTGGCLWSCNLLVRRDVFEAVGGFDERFPFACMEDVDLRERLKAAGAVMTFAPLAAVVHPWRSISEREVSRQIISHAIYAAKHPEFVRDWTLLHAARMARSRLRLYRTGGPAAIPRAKYRTVAFDLIAPFALLAVTRLPPLRRRLSGRYSNPLQAAV